MNKENVDASPMGDYWGKCLRVHVNMDMGQPLCRGIKVDVGESSPQWASFQYEHMPIFCYWCDLLKRMNGIVNAGYAVKAH